jgi:hypothetical protein
MASETAIAGLTNVANAAASRAVAATFRRPVVKRMALGVRRDIFVKISL